MAKIYYINSMLDGSIVNPVHLVGIMKNLKVIRVTDSSVLVDGFQREGPDAPWTNFRGYISTSVRVTIAEDEEAEEVAPRTKEKIIKAKKPIIVLEYPKEFTIKDLAAKYPEVNKAKIYIMVQEEIKAGRVKKIGEIKNKRGKNTIKYELIN